MGQVPMGMGLDPNLFTCWKPIPTSTCTHIYMAGWLKMVIQKNNGTSRSSQTQL